MEAWTRRHPALATAAIFLAAWCLLFGCMAREINPFDEGLVLTDALRTFQGDLVHRDFLSPYAPGSYYILAALFSITKYSFVAARLYGTAVAAGVVAATFCLLATRTALSVCLIATAICGMWMLSAQVYLYPLFPCLLLSLIGSGLLLAWLENRGPAFMLSAGACAGASALFRYDSGFFLLLAHGIVLTLILKPYRSSRDGRQVWFRALLLYACGTAAIFLPAAIAFLSVARVSDFARDIIDYPTRYYVEMRGLPFPLLAAVREHPVQIAVYFPIFALLVGAGAAILFRRRVRPAIDRTALSSLILFATLTAVLYYKGVVRASTLHLLMSIVPALLFLSLLIDISWKQGGRGRILAILGFWVAAVPPLMGVTGQLMMSWQDPARTPIGLLALKELKRDGKPVERRCVDDPRVALARERFDHAAINNYLRRYTGRQEPIFIGLDRHDKIYANAVALYFTADRRPGTHWHQFDPGNQTRADIQQWMIADLVRNHVRWVIRDASFGDVHEPNGSDRSSGVKLLDRFLDTHYRAVAAKGQIQIWLLNGVPAPALTGDTLCLPAPLIRHASA